MITKCSKSVFFFALFTVVAAGRSAAQFSVDSLRQKAREMSAKKYEARSADDLPDWLAKLDFDNYHRLQFRPDATLWSGERLPFRVQFSHRGYLFPYRLPIHLIDVDGGVTDARFSRAQFQYGLDAPGEVSDELGYAGMKVLLQPETVGAGPEIASFLGASYFRVLGEGQRYGASARGLAIDTASPTGEEFPQFVEMWIKEPALTAKELEICALLDSPSTTGAYRFVLTPGGETAVDVSAWLYPRREVAKLGLAPLTSMFLYGEQRLRYFPDYRPEVHDSDGLLFEGDAGEWIWRPLSNPQGEHRISRFPLAHPKGFGLLQRDRAFESYADLEARFECRVSYWVTPTGDWGDGALELVEIPSDAERNDNIVAYWVPARAPVVGQEFSFQYKLSAFLDEPTRPPLARVRATRVQPSGSSALFVLDFEGADLENNAEPLTAEIRASSAEIRNIVLQPNEAVGGKRCAFELVGAGDDAVELRAWLRRGERRVSETWLSQWQKH